MSRSRVKTRSVVAKPAVATVSGAPHHEDERENIQHSARLLSYGRLGPSVAHALTMDLHRLLHRVRSEFNEMPGLQLTLPQAARLWGLDHEASRLVIDALVERSFLRWTARGTVIRVDRAAA
jgi:hypothetical protein